MNCFNGSKFLNKSIISLIDQKYKNWELIFWDNNSTDDSLEIVKSFQNPKFSVFQSNINEKLYHARNRAMSHVKGDIICFLDIDDWWSNNKLNLYNHAFNKYDCDFVYGNFFNFYESGKLKKRLFKFFPQPSGYIYKNLLKNYVVSLPTLAFRKSCLYKVKKFNEDYNIIGDFDFVMKLSKKYKSKYIYIPTAYYRHHHNNYSIINIDEHIDELKNWILNNKDIDHNNIIDRINYLKCLKFLGQKNYKIFFRNLLFIKSLKIKTKLIGILLFNL